MSSLQKITRSDHVASLMLPPGRVARVLGRLRRADVLLRIGICLLAAVCMWLITCGWRPPFGYRIGYLPDRDICASVAFSVPDPEGTERLREKKRSEVTCTYTHDDRPLKELRSALKSQVFQVLAAESAAKVDPRVWAEFLPADDAQEPNDPPSVPSEAAFPAMRTALQGDSDLTLFARAVQRTFQQFEETGLLEQLGHPPEDGSQISVKVHPLGKPDFLQLVDVKKVRIAEVTTDLKSRLAEEFRQAKLPSGEVERLADLVNNWLTKRGLGDHPHARHRSDAARIRRNTVESLCPVRIFPERQTGPGWAADYAGETGGPAARASGGAQHDDRRRQAGL